MNGASRPLRVRERHTEWVAERLSDRDWAIVRSVSQLRLLSGSQLERLHFSDLSGRSRSVVRARVLHRLVEWRVLLPLPRRVGGFAHGSRGLVYALDSAGVLLDRQRRITSGQERRLRRPRTPGQLFIAHTLAVSELYVQLIEASRYDAFQVAAFEVEPASWTSDGFGGWLRPDAFLQLTIARVEDSWWLEVDLATEHLPTIRRKAMTYLDFLARGRTGPQSVMPRVLFSVPDQRRGQAMQAMLADLPEPADQLFHVATADAAAAYVSVLLRQEAPT